MCYADTPMQVLHCLHEGLEQVFRKFLSENEWLGDSILLSNLLEQLEHIRVRAVLKEHAVKGGGIQVDLGGVRIRDHLLG
jgi:hypothetical protein